MALILRFDGIADVRKGEGGGEIRALHKNLSDQIPFGWKGGEKDHSLHHRSDGEVVGGEASKDGRHFLYLRDGVATLQFDRKSRFEVCKVR